MPIRATWSSERSDLIYTDEEQAYRFVKNITDAGGSITFSTTTNTDGTTMEDEEEVLKYVNEQMLASTSPTAYLRPEGAYLVNKDITLGIEETTENEDVSFTIKPNPVANSFEASKEFKSAIIYNFLGKKVLEFLGDKNGYDVSKLETGFYLLKIMDDKANTQIIRFVKE